MKKLITTIGIVFAFGGSVQATTITASSATATVLNPAPLTMNSTEPTSNTQIFGWVEQQNYTLTQPLTVNVSGATAGTYNGASYPTTTVPTGTIVNSFILHYNKTTGNAPITASFTFNSVIIGLIYQTTLLDNSDFLRPTGSTYVGQGSRGIDDADDTVTISANLRTIVFTAGGSNRDQIRVLTYTVEDVPEPGTWAMMGTGLVGLAWFRRKRST